QQEAPAAGQPRGYSRLAVMDGKTIPHQKCALDACEGALLNYKNGRFCEAHINLRDVCGIDHAVTGPALRVELASLGDTPGDQVVHTFKAKSTYCLQTVQWACGFPIGWGKCYRSESSSQVLGILNKIWEDYPDAKPSFIAYDDACSPLRHILTQDANSSSLISTKFIVDAWHYISHRATDILCRLWCNPAPLNGSQPDLIRVEEDANGTTHQTRAFNTETAEQLNSWLSGFESQLRHMSAVNYDLYIHVLMMIYGERVQKQVHSRDLGLSEEFWAEAIGD
ncbi:hypothetical protein FB451DRAFT_1054473, partial [Mycena latifolia]